MRAIPTLKISISGVRGVVGDSLTPVLLTRFAQAFGTYVSSGASSSAATRARRGRWCASRWWPACSRAAAASWTSACVRCRPSSSWCGTWAHRVASPSTASTNPAEWNALSSSATTGCSSVGARPRVARHLPPGRLHEGERRLHARHRDHAARVIATWRRFSPRSARCPSGRADAACASRSTRATARVGRDATAHRSARRRGRDRDVTPDAASRGGRAAAGAPGRAVGPREVVGRRCRVRAGHGRRSSRGGGRESEPIGEELTLVLAAGHVLAATRGPSR